MLTAGYVVFANLLHLNWFKLFLFIIEFHWTFASALISHDANRFENINRIIIKLELEHILSKWLIFQCPTWTEYYPLLRHLPGLAWAGQDTLFDDYNSNMKNTPNLEQVKHWNWGLVKEKSSSLFLLIHHQAGAGTHFKKKRDFWPEEGDGFDVQDSINTNTTLVSKQLSAEERHTTTT